MRDETHSSYIELLRTQECMCRSQRISTECHVYDCIYTCLAICCVWVQLYAPNELNSQNVRSFNGNMQQYRPILAAWGDLLKGSEYPGLSPYIFKADFTAMSSTPSKTEPNRKKQHGHSSSLFSASCAAPILTPLDSISVIKCIILIGAPGNSMLPRWRLWGRRCMPSQHRVMALVLKASVST